MITLKNRVGLLAATVATAALATLGAGGASAQTVTGWVGPTGQDENGITYLDTSSITNSPALTAQSTIYPSFGQTVPAGTMGVRSRLFKSGVLCQAIDYRYNPGSATTFTAGTTLTCGSGSYNSHGFVSVYDSTKGYQEYLTFPSNPLNWTAPKTARAAQSAQPAEVVEVVEVVEGTNTAGQRYGSGDKATSAALPELIQAYATNGKVGYVKKADLSGRTAKNPGEAATLKPGSRSISVYNSDGTTVIGQFTVN